MSAGAELQTLLKKHPVSAVAVALSVACGILLYIRSTDVAELTTDSAAKTEQAAKMQSNITAATGLAEQTEELRKATAEIDSRLVRASLLANNIRYFYGIEAESGAKIVDVRQGTVPAAKPGTPARTYTGIPYNVSIQGTYPQVLAFLKRLETGRHFSRFLNVTFTKAGGQDAGDMMNLSINLELLGQP